MAFPLAALALALPALAVGGKDWMEGRNRKGQAEGLALEQAQRASDMQKWQSLVAGYTKALGSREAADAYLADKVGQDENITGLVKRIFGGQLHAVERPTQYQVPKNISTSTRFGEDPLTVDMETVDGTSYSPVMPVSPQDAFADSVKGSRDPLQMYTEGVRQGIWNKPPSASYGTMGSTNMKNMMDAMLNSAKAGRVPFQIKSDQALTGQRNAAAQLDRTKTSMGGFAPKVVQDDSGNAVQIPAMGQPRSFPAGQTGLTGKKGTTKLGSFDSARKQLESFYYPPGPMGQINRMEGTPQGDQKSTAYARGLQQFMEAQAMGMNSTEAYQAGTLSPEKWEAVKAKAGIRPEQIKGLMAPGAPTQGGQLPGGAGTDPVLQKIEELRSQGMSDDQIAQLVREQGGDPAQYGLE